MTNTITTAELLGKPKRTGKVEGYIDILSSADRKAESAQVIFGFRRGEHRIPIAKKIGHYIYPIGSTINCYEDIEELKYVIKIYKIALFTIQLVKNGETEMSAALRAAIAEVEKDEDSE